MVPTLALRMPGFRVISQIVYSDSECKRYVAKWTLKSRSDAKLRTVPISHLTEVDRTKQFHAGKKNFLVSTSQRLYFLTSTDKATPPQKLA